MRRQGAGRVVVDCDAATTAVAFAKAELAWIKGVPLGSRQGTPIVG